MKDLKKPLIPLLAMRRLLKSKSNSQGVSAVEVAILMPFFLTLVYGIIYLSLYLAVQGILDTAATRALTKASSAQDFEVSTSGPPNCTISADDPFCVAIENLKTEMKSVASSVFVQPSEESAGLAYLTNTASNPVISWPAATGDKSYEQVLQSVPITISITAEIRTFIPFFPSFRAVGRAAGFRETRKSLSYPVKTDCNGYPVGHAMYKQRPCVCVTPNSVWNPTNEACEVCDQGRAVPTIDMNTGNMSPPPGFVIITPVPANDWPPQYCACPDTGLCRQRHGDSAMLFWNSCRCGCKNLARESGNVVLNVTESDGTPTYEECPRCKAGVPPQPTGMIAPSAAWPFTGYEEVSNGECACVPKLTDAYCKSLFPPEMADVIVADPLGCTCVCAGRYCTADGSGITNSNPASGPPGAGSASVVWYNPSHSQCHCGCYETSVDMHASTSRSLQGGTCACNTPCLGNGRTRGVDDDCTEATCRCPANPCPTPGDIRNDSDPNCGCISGTSNSGQ